MTRTMNSKMNKTMTAACAGAAFCCACAASNTVILSVLGAIIMASIIVYRKPLAGRVVQKRLLPMRKNKTPSAIVEMRSGNYKLQNKGRPFKNEVAKTV